MKTWGRVSLIVSVCLLAAGCGGDDDDTTVVDGSVTTVDGAVTMPDASTMAANNSYSLNGASTPAQQVVCNADLIAGSNSNRTSFSFIFLGTPTAGTYTVQAATAAGMRPTAAGMVTLRYGSDPAGGPKVDQMGQSGTVTVDLVGGKLHAVATGIPSKELVSMATGTIAGNLTCP